MSAHPVSPFPILHCLPASFPLERAVRLELQEGLPLFRASAVVQRRITALLRKQQEASLCVDETAELDQYEELDDYLSFLNRVVRNLLHSSQP